MGQEFARRRRGFPALAGAASAVSFSPLPCEGRGGLGRGAFWIIRTVGTPSQPPPAFAGGGARALFRGNVLLAADPRHRQAVLLERLEAGVRSEEHTSELQSLMRISYAVFCWK